MKIYNCEKCHTPISMKIIKGNVHICCPKCHQSYCFDQKSIKRYMFLPFLCVIFAVMTSMYYLKDASIDMKTIYILGVSFVLAALLTWFCVKIGVLKYEKKKENK